MSLLASLGTVALLTVGLAPQAGVAPAGASGGSDPQALRGPSVTRGAPKAAAPTGSASSLEDQARRALEAGRREEAERLYRQALTKRPAPLEARWGLATLLYDQDRFADARGEFHRLVEARPGDAQALAFRALCDARLGAKEAAVRDLLRAREMKLPSADLASVVDFQAAVLLNHLGDPDGAFEILKKFGLDSDDRPAVLEVFGLVMLRMPLLPGEAPPSKRGMILLAGRGGYHLARAGRNELGRMALEELVSRYPSEPNVHYALGLYLVQEDPGKAIEEFYRELAISPEHIVAMIQIALSELRRGRAKEALPMAERAVSLSPNVPAARLALGRALLAVGETDRGVSEMEAAVRLAPEVPRLRYSLVQAYQQAGRSEDAARERSEFQKLNKASGTVPGGEPGAQP